MKLQKIKQFNKRNKWKLIFGAAIIVTTATVTPLCYVYTQNNIQVNDLGNFDATYDVNDATYLRLEKQFEAKYKLQLNKEQASTKEINSKIAQLQSDLKQIKTQLYRNDDEKYSYTIRTNILIDFAQNNYKIILNSSTNASWEDFEEIKQSYQNSLVQHMRNLKLSDDEITSQLEKYKSKFNQLVVDAKNKYDDPLSAIIAVKGDIAQCFEGISQETSLIAATTQLKKFLSRYTFSAKQKPLYYWNELEKMPDFSTIDNNVDKYITDLFICTDNQTKQTILFDSKNMLPGYDINAIFKKMGPDAETNKYTISLDWQLINKELLIKITL